MSVAQEFKTLVKHCLTSIDGTTYDPARVFWAIGNLVFFVLSFIILYQCQNAVDSSFLLNWSGAFSAVQVAGAGGVLLKAKTEPKE